MVQFMTWMESYYIMVFLWIERYHFSQITLYDFNDFHASPSAVNPEY